jgi:hypothetical protein
MNFDNRDERMKYGQEIQERVHKAIYHYAARNKPLHRGDPPFRLRLHGDRYWSWVSYLWAELKHVEFGYVDDTAFLFCGVMIFTEENPDNTPMRIYRKPKHASAHCI